MFCFPPLVGSDADVRAEVFGLHQTNLQANVINAMMVMMVMMLMMVMIMMMMTTRCPRYDNSGGGHNWAATWTRVDSDYTEAADLTSWVVGMMSRAKWKDQASQDLWKDQASQARAHDLSRLSAVKIPKPGDIGIPQRLGHTQADRHISNEQILLESRKVAKARTVG